MSDENRILIFGGIALVAVTMFFGVYYAFLDEHQTLVGMGISLATGFAEAAAGNLEAARQAIASYDALSGEYRLEVHFHSHIGFLGLALILIGLLGHELGFSAMFRRRLAFVLTASAFLFPAGVLLQTAAGSASIGKVIAVVGTAGLVGSVLVGALGVLRASSEA